MNNSMLLPSDVFVLIACEESQAECLAFRRRGFIAFSCDLQKCSGGHPEFHILTDVTPLLHGMQDFVTMDGVMHHVHHWHLIIAHPPCTYLCKVSAVHMVVGGVLNENRYNLMLEARRFFLECYAADAEVRNAFYLKCNVDAAFYALHRDSSACKSLRNKT